jgi:hypothetical protein
MTIDARLREGLQRSMSAIDTDAEHHLNDARRRGHKRLVIRRAVAAIAVAAIFAIVVVAAPHVLDLVRDQRHHQPAISPSLLPIFGTYSTTISAKDTTGGRDAGSVGTWLLTLDRDGTLDLASLTNGDRGRSVTQYQTTGGEFLTTALAGSTCSGSGLGRYSWSRSGALLTFTVVSDACPLRVAIFSSQPWIPA